MRELTDDDIKRLAKAAGILDFEEWWQPEIPRLRKFLELVEAEKKGSIWAVVGSGMRVMSDSLIAFQPAMEEPSNMMPSANRSSSTMPTSKVTCCHLPRGSVKRKSTY